MIDILQKLKGGDRRSIGRVDEVVEDVRKDPSLFEELFYGMLDRDPIVRMRSADTVEKLTVKQPDYLIPYKKVLLETEYLEDKSKIVKTFSMQALADFARSDLKLRPQVIQLIEERIKTGSPAVKSRGKNCCFN